MPSEHRVTFAAEAQGPPIDATRACLVARCSCGWYSAFIPNPDREAAILAIGRRHVERELVAEGVSDADE